MAAGKHYAGAGSVLARHLQDAADSRPEGNTAEAPGRTVNPARPAAPGHGGGLAPLPQKDGHHAPNPRPGRPGA
eukprot:4432695-Lingulodinium_polyedra.AAC.1